MFTGLVTDVGRVGAIEDRNGLRRISIRSRNFRPEHIQLGASIQHSGVCLTVVDFGPDDEGAWWDIEAIPETLSRTTIGQWKVDTFVNLELSLKLGDELGGHIVTGHVDGVGLLADRHGALRKAQYCIGNPRVGPGGLYPMQQVRDGVSARGTG